MRKKIVRVSRVQMNASDVLESLLIVLGVQNYPAGTIQRFTTLRRKLKEFEDAEVRVFVVVEDAVRTGVDTLAEIEALTSAGTGVLEELADMSGYTDAQNQLVTDLLEHEAAHHRFRFPWCVLETRLHPATRLCWCRPCRR